MAMARVWFICVFVPPSSRAGVGACRGAGAGAGRDCRELIEDDRSGGLSLDPDLIDIRGKLVLPGRGLVEFCRRGSDDMMMQELFGERVGKL